MNAPTTSLIGTHTTASGAISVVIPTYNRLHTVVHAIKSVLSQTRRPDEIIVVDDGSTDGTTSALSAYGRDIRLLVQENRGVSAARNLGAAAATGEWLTFLDSDDVWLPDRLALLERDTRLHECDVHVGNFIYSGPGYEESFFRLRGLDDRGGYSQSGLAALKIALSFPQIGAVAIRRSRFEEMNGFDESMTIHEDTHLLVRLSQGAAWTLAPDVVAEVRRFTGATPPLSVQSKSKAVYAAAMKVKVFEDLIDAGTLDRPCSFIIRKEFSGALFELSRRHWDAGDHSAARATLVRSARQHPCLYGWLKAAPPFFLGLIGYNIIERPKRGFLRSDFDPVR
jgi:glycosyltransferase involved in cell wall biosynthesis